jgi:hypothetical protein
VHPYPSVSVERPEPTLSPAAEIEPSRRPVRLLAVPARLFCALFLPDRTLPVEAQAGRYGWALATVVLIALATSAVIGARLDVTPDVQVADAVEGGKPGEQALRGEHEIAEDVAKARAMNRVTMGLGAAFGTPAWILLLAIILFLGGRYVGGRPTMRRTMSLASHAALPSAVHSIFVLVAATQAPRLTAADVPSLGALGWPIDPFLLWAGVLVLLGFPAAASVSRTKGAIAVVIGFGLFLCLRQIMGAR